MPTSPPFFPGAPSGPAGGDLAGTYPNPTVAAGLSTSKLSGFPNDNKKALRGSGNWGTVDKDDLLLAGQGLVAWTFDRATGAGSVATATGTMRLTGIPLVSGMVLTNGVMLATGTGSGMTHGYIALYSSAFALLAQTADNAAAFNTSGVKVIALTAPYTVTVDGYYFAAFLGTTGATMPNFLGGNTTSTLGQVEIGTGKGRSGQQAGLTAPPDPAVMVTNVANGPLWLGFS